MKRILCIRLPNWPIQRLSAARPELKDRVDHRTLPIAKRLLQSERDPLADREALKTLAAYCGRFSPIVGLEASDVPDSLLLDITGVARFFGGEAPLAEKIVRDFARRRLVVRVAIADTIGTAWAVAHYRGQREEGRGERAGGRGQKTEGRGREGKRGSEDCKMTIANCKLQIENFDSLPPPPAFRLPPSVVVIVPPDENAAVLRPIPIEGLRLPQQTVELLHQLGIRRIGQLEALRRRELSSRFGPRLLERMDQAAGRLAEPVAAHQPPPEFEAAWSPEYPTLRRETVEAALEQLIARVAQKLTRCGRGAVRLECRLECDSAEPAQVSVGLFEPATSAAHLFGLVRLQFERLRLPGPVVAMHVAAAATAPLQGRQQELFADDSPRRGPHHLAALIDRLSSRLGRRCVLGVRLLRDAQPELAWQYDPVLGSSGRRRSRSIAPAELAPRPLRLLQRPIALRAMSIIPGGPPLRFRLSGREHRIAHTWGPERIETGWWRGNAVGRDYYRVETAAGRRFWLFRRLCDGRWFLHGMFE